MNDQNSPIRSLVKEGYAQLIDRVDPHIFVTLNTDKNNTAEELSKIIKKMFYRAECRLFGRKLRDHCRKSCRITRYVAIEHAKSKDKKTHAHVLVRRIGNYTDNQFIGILQESYAETLAEQKYEERTKFGVIRSISKNYLRCKGMHSFDDIQQQILSEERKIAKNKKIVYESDFRREYYFKADPIRDMVGTKIYCTKEIYEMNSDVVNLDASFIE